MPKAEIRERIARRFKIGVVDALNTHCAGDLDEHQPVIDVDHILSRHLGAIQI